MFDAQLVRGKLMFSAQVLSGADSPFEMLQDAAKCYRVTRRLSM
jgi:hypothetical protein